MSQERPILFSAPMVRAILDGRKTMTRRPVKLRGAEVIEERDDALSSSWPWSPQHDGWVACPYGRPGDRLWVREAFGVGRPLRNSDGVADAELVWSGPLPSKDPRGARLMDDWCVGYAADGCEGRMRSPIHMPRWASRITLEVTDVRVERLQAITEKAVYAEGVQIPVTTDGCLPGKGAVLHSISGRFPSIKYARPGADTIDIVRAHFASAWDTVHGADAWAANPWVWVVSFKRVT